MSIKVVRNVGFFDVVRITTDLGNAYGVRFRNSDQYLVDENKRVRAFMTAEDAAVVARESLDTFRKRGGVTRKVWKPREAR